MHISPIFSCRVTSVHMYEYAFIHIYIYVCMCVFIYTTDDEIFATIILKSKRDNIPDKSISLYEPVGSKVIFQQLQVSHKRLNPLCILQITESFKWKQINVIDKALKVAIAWYK